MSTLVNYLPAFQHFNPSDNSSIMQGKGRNVLRLEKLDAPHTRADGKRVSYQLEYRWLSTDCEHPDDEAFVCVMGNEFSYYSAKELRATFGLRTGKQGIVVPDDIDLFEHVILM
jgi:hypothetical protein